MDIHPPMKHMDSLKEYAAHILIVTIGILIALGLEGIRESWREHHAVKEATNSFRAELALNRKQLALDQETIVKASTQLDQIIAEMPQLVKNPPELQKRVDQIGPGFYFFSTAAWESAQAEGTVSHIDRKE